MGQSKLDSLKEVCTNIIIGGIIAWFITYIVVVNVKNPSLASLLSVVGCTVASLIRGYYVRRHFNKIMEDTK